METVSDPASERAQPAAINNGQSIYVHREVAVIDSGGVFATVVVTVQQGQVWMSIRPPFTWEAIMTPQKVDELIRTLALTAEDAKRMLRARSIYG